MHWHAVQQRQRQLQEYIVGIQYGHDKLHGLQNNKMRMRMKMRVKVIAITYRIACSTVKSVNVRLQVLPQLDDEDLVYLASAGPATQTYHEGLMQHILGRVSFTRKKKHHLGMRESV